MPTTKEMIRQWFKEGVRQKATHMIVVVETFSHEDYPVYVKKGEDVKGIVAKKYSGQNMQSTMEVYNLSRPMDEQINSKRVFNF